MRACFFPGKLVKIAIDIALACRSSEPHRLVQLLCMQTYLREKISPRFCGESKKYARKKVRCAKKDVMQGRIGVGVGVSRSLSLKKARLVRSLD